jgi:hypothetical protein
LRLLHEKHFTIDEAQDLVDELRMLVEQMVKLKQELDAMGYDIYHHQYFGGSGPNGTGAFPEQMDELVAAVKLIHSKGVLIKDIDQGLMDFPHIRANGEEVYLCWKLGEERIGFWHRIEDGFAGRRGIAEL